MSCSTDLMTSKNKYEPSVDRITSLPESLQTHILTFLPIKEAIRTCILSRGWRYSSSFLPVLDFDPNTLGGGSNRKTRKSAVYGDFIDDVLRCRTDTAVIEKMILCVEGEFITTRRIDSWISFAVDHNVRHLFVYPSRSLKKIITLPPCLFSATSLSVLKLAHIHLQSPPKETNIAALPPMLKVIDLAWVTFHDDYFFEYLFSSCPHLNELRIYWCVGRVVHHAMTISAPKLKIFKNVNDDYSYFENLTIHAPNLKTIRFLLPHIHRSEPYPSVTSETLSSVTTAFIGNNSMNATDSTYEYFAKTWMRLSNVVSLVWFDTFFMEFLSRAPDFLAQLPESSRLSLKHLELCIHSTRSHVQLMTNLLRSYPDLQTLKINVLENSKSPEKMLGTYDQGLQHIIPLNTKHIGIKKFDGSEIEVNLVKYFLEKATTLAKMDINYSNRLRHNSEARLMLSKRLLTFGIASPRVVMRFFT